MIRKLAIVASALAMSTLASPLLAKGCIRGALMGGVAGHYVGRGHALAGAAAGCLIAHHHFAEQAKAQRAAGRHW